MRPRTLPLLAPPLQYGCLVVNAPTANTVAAAEHGIALLCAMARNVSQADSSMKGGKWERNKYVGVSMVGKTLAIMGFGKVGAWLLLRVCGWVGGCVGGGGGGEQGIWVEEPAEGGWCGVWVVDECGVRGAHGVCRCRSRLCHTTQNPHPRTPPPSLCPSQVGGEVARRAKGLGMSVVAHDPYASEERAAALGVTLVSFDEALATGDFFSLHMPLTPGTKGMFNDDAFANVGGWVGG
jgi:hypothetical protein